MKALKLESNNDFSLLDLIGHPVVAVNSHSQVIYANHSVKSLLGFECVDHFLSKLLQCQDGTEFKPAPLLLNREQPIRCTYKQDNNIKHLDAYIKSSRHSGKNLFIISFIDVTSYVEKENALFHEATIDPLTGIYNRRHFYFQFEKELKRSDRDNSDIALLLIDIDYFKDVNDEFGHAMGDKALQKVTNIVKQELRDIDIFGRLGGEEFAVILPKADTEKAHGVADRLRKRIKHNKIIVNRTSISLTVSIGVISKKGKALSQQMMQQADKALYIAKNSGRDTVCCHNLLETVV